MEFDLSTVPFSRFGSYMCFNILPKGWNLPGVMGAGAVNGLAKEADLSPAGKVVLAGSGPLLLLEAGLLIEKGVEIAAILETTPKIPSVSALPHVPKSLLGTEFLMKGVKMIGGVNYERISPEGLHISFGEAREKPQLIECDTVVLCAGQVSDRSLADALEAEGITPHVIGGADVAAELDAKRAIDQGARLAAGL